MKDKIAKKRKKMRQRLKQVERCKEESALVENFKKVAEKHGVKKFNTKKALQAYKVVEVEATKEAIVNCVRCVVFTYKVRLESKTIGAVHNICA